MFATQSHESDDEIYLEIKVNGSLFRTVNLVQGCIYRVEPLDSQALRDRGRICTLLSLEDGSGKNGFKDIGIVKFHDNNRTGKVKLESLVEV